MAVRAFLVQVTLHKTVSPFAKEVVIETAVVIDHAVEHQAASPTSPVSLDRRAAQQPQIPGRMMFQLFRVSLAT